MALARISALFWDVGGVLLTNAWDHEQRQQTLKQFGLDEAEFESRHEMLVSSFERGKITLQDYLSARSSTVPGPLRSKLSPSTCFRFRNLIRKLCNLRGN